MLRILLERGKFLALSKKGRKTKMVSSQRGRSLFLKTSKGR